MVSLVLAEWISPVRLRPSFETALWLKIVSTTFQPPQNHPEGPAGAILRTLNSKTNQNHKNKFWRGDSQWQGGNHPSVSFPQE